MKKISLFLITILMLIITLVSCDDEPEANVETPHTHSLEYVARVEPTCLEDGHIAYWYCSGCDRYFTDDKAEYSIAESGLVIAKLGHDIVNVAAKAPTESEVGWQAYEYCTRCDYSTYQEIPVLDHTHDIKTHEAVNKTCTSDGNILYYECSICHKYFSDEAATKEISLEDTIIPMSHNVIGYDPVDKTCTTDGNILYYECLDCHKLYSDRNLTNEISREDIIIPKSHNLTYNEGEDATCTSEGLLDHYHCSICDKYYEDSEATKELAEVVIPKTPHDYDSHGVCNTCGFEAVKYELVTDNSGSYYDVVSCDSSLKGDLILPSEYQGYPVKNIRASAFYGCSLGSITIPNTLETIGSSAFQASRDFESFYYAEGSILKSIGDYAFSECTVLTTCRIPDSVESIGHRAFDRTKVYETVDGVRYVGNWAVQYNSSTATTSIREGTIGLSDRLFEASSNVATMSLPASLRYIGKQAFSRVNTLNTVTIPDNSELMTIGEDAFYNCSAIVSITLPNSVSSIGESAFEGCASLVSINIPTSLTTIANNLFNNCSSLASITIPAHITSIGEQAYSGCSSATTLTFADNSKLETIGYRAFLNCSSIVLAILPSSLKTLSSGAFNGCSNLESVAIPESVTRVGSNIVANATKATLYCEVEARLSSWDLTWNYSNNNVMWNIRYTGEIIRYDFIYNNSIFSNSTLQFRDPFEPPAAINSTNKLMVIGWFDNADLSGDPIEGLYYNPDGGTLYAKVLDYSLADITTSGFDLKSSYLQSNLTAVGSTSTLSITAGSSDIAVNLAIKLPTDYFDYISLDWKYPDSDGPIEYNINGRIDNWYNLSRTIPAGVTLEITYHLRTTTGGDCAYIRFLSITNK